MIRITAILVSRFLNDLQSANRAALDITSSQYEAGREANASTSLVFERVVNSFGTSFVTNSRHSVENPQDDYQADSTGTPQEEIEMVPRSFEHEG